MMRVMRPYFSIVNQEAYTCTQRKPRSIIHGWTFTPHNHVLLNKSSFNSGVKTEEIAMWIPKHGVLGRLDVARERRIEKEVESDEN